MPVRKTSNHLLSDIFLCVLLRPMSISFYHYRTLCVATVYICTECVLGGTECREMYWREENLEVEEETVENEKLSIVTV